MASPTSTRISARLKRVQGPAQFSREHSRVRPKGHVHSSAFEHACFYPLSIENTVCPVCYEWRLITAPMQYPRVGGAAPLLAGPVERRPTYTREPCRLNTFHPSRDVSTGWRRHSTGAGGASQNYYRISARLKRVQEDSSPVNMSTRHFLDKTAHGLGGSGLVSRARRPHFGFCKSRAHITVFSSQNISKIDLRSYS